MSRPDRILLALAVCAAGLVAPTGASAHAYLIKTVPAASGVLDTAPRQVALTYDEAVEPRFAIISVTDVAGRQQTTGPVSRSPVDPDTLTAPLRPGLPEGWYLIYWRAISVDGHPVQGAFTYAVGPNPGPAPQFSIPSISATATSINLLIARGAMFLTVMVAIGLFVLRMLILRPLVRRVPGMSLRAITIAFLVMSVLGLIAIPIYLDFAIANDSLRSVFDLGTLLALYRVTAFGRSYLDLAVCFALFCIAAWISLWTDRPRRELRSIVELASITGALLAAAAVLVIPGAAGHAGQTSPRGVSLMLDWLHLVAGSIWLGGLAGLLILWRSLAPAQRTAGLAVAVPRFSNIALPSVLALLATGTLATIIHMPVLDALWKTGYGVAILVKIGLLSVAVVFAANNRLRAKPALIAAIADAGPGVLARPDQPGSDDPAPGAITRPARPASDDPEPGERAGRLLRRMLGGEALVVTAAVFAAAVLSSLSPPPPAFALQNSALAQVGPGRVAATVQRAGYKLQVLVAPNRAAAPDSFALRITRQGEPVRGADVTLTFNHTEMEMPQQEYQLTEIRPGLYARAAPALVMVGKWALAFGVTPSGGPSFTALIIDQANG